MRPHLTLEKHRALRSDRCRRPAWPPRACGVGAQLLGNLRDGNGMQIDDAVDVSNSSCSAPSCGRRRDNCRGAGHRWAGCRKDAALHAVCGFAGARRVIAAYRWRAARQCGRSGRAATALRPPTRAAPRSAAPRRADAPAPMSRAKAPAPPPTEPGRMEHQRPGGDHGRPSRLASSARGTRRRNRGSTPEGPGCEGGAQDAALSQARAVAGAIADMGERDQRSATPEPDADHGSAHHLHRRLGILAREAARRQRLDQD